MSRVIVAVGDGLKWTGKKRSGLAYKWELVRCHFAAVKNFRVEGCGEKERVRQSSLPVTRRYGAGQDRGGETQNGEGWGKGGDSGLRGGGKVFFLMHDLPVCYIQDCMLPFFSLPQVIKRSFRQMRSLQLLTVYPVHSTVKNPEFRHCVACIICTTESLNISVLIHFSVSKLSLLTEVFPFHKLNIVL